MTENTVETLYAKLLQEAKNGGYHLNPDVDFSKSLVEGLVTNEERYGYRACPCRLASGEKAEDLDILCPCDYRDPDLHEYGMCYCGLYVSGNILDGSEEMHSIPERRGEEPVVKAEAISVGSLVLPLPVYRCKVCGYLCAREQPPAVCPICKVDQERFERFI